MILEIAKKVLTNIKIHTLATKIENALSGFEVETL